MACPGKWKHGISLWCNFDPYPYVSRTWDRTKLGDCWSTLDPGTSATTLFFQYPEARDWGLSTNLALRPPTTSGVSNGGVGSSIESPRSLWVFSFMAQVTSTQNKYDTTQPEAPACPTFYTDPRELVQRGHCQRGALLFEKPTQASLLVGLKLGRPGLLGSTCRSSHSENNSEQASVAKDPSKQALLQKFPLSFRLQHPLKINKQTFETLANESETMESSPINVLNR